MIKKSIITVTLLLLIITAAFTQDTTYFTRKWVKTTKDSAYYYRIFKDTANFFVFKDYYPTRKIQMTGYSKTRDSLDQFGTSKYYSEKGELKSIENYKSNVLNGEHIDFYPNGNIKEKRRYIDGLIAGEFLVYNSEGQITFQLNFQFKHKIPFLKQKLRFNKTRWGISPSLESKRFNKIMFTANPFDSHQKYLNPANLYIFKFNHNIDDNPENEYIDVMKSFKGFNANFYTFPKKLPKQYFDSRTFESASEDNIKYKWTSVWYHTSPDSAILILFEVEEKYWAEHIDEFAEILQNFH